VEVVSLQCILCFTRIVTAFRS